MGGWAQALGQTAGQAGNDIGTAYDKNVNDALHLIQNKLMLTEVQQKLKQMNAPQFHGTVPTPSGGVNAIVRDPNSGAVTTQAISQGLDPKAVSDRIDQISASSPPSLKPVFDQLKGTLTMGSGLPGFNPHDVLTRALQIQSTAAEKLTATGKAPTPEMKDGVFFGLRNPLTNELYTQSMYDKGTIPAEFRDQFADAKNAAAGKSTSEFQAMRLAHPDWSVDKVIQTLHPKQYQDSGGPVPGEIAAYADDVKNGRMKITAVPMNRRGSVTVFMKQNGMAAPKILTADEQKGVDSISQAMPLMEDSKKLLEGMKDDNSISSALKTRGYWAMYNQGIAPPEPYASYFQTAALMRVMMISPYLHGIRNMAFVKQIQQHMPNPESDTPKFMYDKITKLQPILEKMQGDIQGTKPISAPSGPPSGATMRVPGSDGKLHWSDGKVDLGVIPDGQ